MARQLTPLGRALIVVSGLCMVGYGLYRYGVLGKIASVVAPDKKAEGTVSKDDFGSPGKEAAGTPATTPVAASSSAPIAPGSGARLNARSGSGS